ncbi:hypothetical protein OHS59_07810 [Streptomyces sp. NBC_00414]|uniref:hypothetical protein n=1 Tax=Streptomyces sp. NBC_00414 TaxID=2975739 RepID=UPI002E22447D
METSQCVVREPEGVLAYLEDPTPTISGTAEVARTSPVPLHYPWNLADETVGRGHARPMWREHARPM